MKRKPIIAKDGYIPNSVVRAAIGFVKPKSPTPEWRLKPVLYLSVIVVFCIARLPQSRISPFLILLCVNFICTTICHAHTNTHARTHTYIHTRHYSFCRLLEIEIIEIFLHTFVTYIQTNTYTHTHTYIHAYTLTYIYSLYKVSHN